MRKGLALFLSSTFSSKSSQLFLTRRSHFLAFPIFSQNYPKRSFVAAKETLSTCSNKFSVQTKRSMTSQQQQQLEVSTGYLTSSSAYELDQELMKQPGFSLEQLMELAGLSVAEAAYHSLHGNTNPNDMGKNGTILILCGPGNNGGDGLVAARHLFHYGFSCIVVYPKRSKGNHFVNLVAQCENIGIPVLDEIPEMSTSEEENEVFTYDLIIDAVFGFSFKGAPREPLATLLRQMIHLQADYHTPVLSVDIPSGWHVEDGNISTDKAYQFEPDVLISLTAPKQCALKFKGRHFVGGRFLPDFLGNKYGIKMPPYMGTSQVYEMSKYQCEE